MNTELKSAQTEPTHTNEELYHKQMELLKTFLEKVAIAQAQYEKSAHDLTEKMGFGKASKER